VAAESVPTGRRPPRINSCLTNRTSSVKRRFRLSRSA
jgi:hypothetical protein